MTAAATPAVSDADAAQVAGAYHSACVQLLHAVCNSNSSSSSSGGAVAAAAVLHPQCDSSRVSEALTLACRLQPHVLTACQQQQQQQQQQDGGVSTGCSVLLHRLLLSGLLQRDLHSRTRAVHLLEACVEAGCEPKVG